MIVLSPSPFKWVSLSSHLLYQSCHCCSSLWKWGGWMVQGLDQFNIVKPLFWRRFRRWDSFSDCKMFDTCRRACTCQASKVSCNVFLRLWLEIKFWRQSWHKDIDTRLSLCSGEFQVCFRVKHTRWWWSLVHAIAPVFFCELVQGRSLAFHVSIIRWIWVVIEPDLKDFQYCPSRDIRSQAFVISLRGILDSQHLVSLSGSSSRLLLISCQSNLEPVSCHRFARIQTRQADSSGQAASRMVGLKFDWPQTSLSAA